MLSESLGFEKEREELPVSSTRTLLDYYSSQGHLVAFWEGGIHVKHRDVFVSLVLLFGQANMGDNVSDLCSS